MAWGQEFISLMGMLAYSLQWFAVGLLALLVAHRGGPDSGVMTAVLLSWLTASLVVGLATRSWMQFLNANFLGFLVLLGLSISSLKGLLPDRWFLPLGFAGLAVVGNSLYYWVSHRGINLLALLSQVVPVAVLSGLQYHPDHFNLGEATLLAVLGVAVVVCGGVLGPLGRLIWEFLQRKFSASTLGGEFCPQLGNDP